jgi:hypothetical protein
MVSVPEGFEYPAEPVTLTERIAYAMAAHDAFKGEGRFEPEERRVLQAIINKVRQTYGSRKALNQWLGFGGFDAFQKLRRLVDDDEYAATDAEAKGSVIFAAHCARCDWPSYMGFARAAASILVERPEFREVESAGESDG